MKPDLEQTRSKDPEGRQEIVFKLDQLRGQFLSWLQLLHQPNRKSRAEVETVAAQFSHS